ncbi:amylase [Penaeus vannamei]|uniref:Amylase n=1 Tax=Penaeus vannamei TaxID=6689 RepID=A0A423SCP9_PENVA|nr:amylase [Penaeus vannamei]
MVRRCNAVGVRIFVDVVINHMAALGSEGVGSAGSSFDGAALAFPGVPFAPEDFTPPRLCSSEDGILSNLSSPSDMRNCALLGLADLYGASAYVREQVAGYLNRLVEVGVAGFRVDAARFMWPEDLAAILDLTNDLNTSHGFPPKTRPFVYLEVVNFNDGIIPDQDYYGLGEL